MTIRKFITANINIYNGVILTALFVVSLRQICQKNPRDFNYLANKKQMDIYFYFSDMAWTNYWENTFTKNKYCITYKIGKWKEQNIAKENGGNITKLEEKL